MKKHCLYIALSVAFVLAPQVGFAQSAAPAPSGLNVTCPAGHGSGGFGATQFTNIVVRNAPSNTSNFSITRVRIFDQDGTVILDGLPKGLTKKTIVPGGAVGFSTQENVGNYVGRLTIVTTVNGNEGRGYIDVLAANFDIDTSNNKLISRDTITCSR